MIFYAFRPQILKIKFRQTIYYNLIEIKKKHQSKKKKRNDEMIFLNVSLSFFF